MLTEGKNMGNMGVLSQQIEDFDERNFHKYNQIQNIAT